MRAGDAGGAATEPALRLVVRHEVRVRGGPEDEGVHLVTGRGDDPHAARRDVVLDLLADGGGGKGGHRSSRSPQRTTPSASRGTATRFRMRRSGDCGPSARASRRTTMADS